jgi:hypothetical protein
MLVSRDEWHVSLNGSRRYPNIILWNNISLSLKIAADLSVDDRRSDVSMEHSHPNYQLKGFGKFTARIGAFDGAQQQLSNSNMANADLRETTEDRSQFSFFAEDVNKSYAIERAINHPIARSFLQCGVLEHPLLQG